MIRIAIAAASIAYALPVGAAGFDIQVDNFFVQGGIASAVMKVTNNTGATAEAVYIDCVFMDGNRRAIEIGRTRIQVIKAGEHAYDKASAVTGDAVKYAECGVRKSR